MPRSIIPRNRSRREAAGKYRSILVPLDGSRLSEQAIPLALAFAERAKAKLRLIHVSTPRVLVMPAIPLSAETRRVYLSLELEARKAAKAYLETFTDHLKKQSSSLAISSTTITGPVVPALRKYIKAGKTDLVVMTSRGQGGLRRLWLGSVADAMIRGSSVPVLLVRPEENPSPRPILENLQQILVPLDGSPLAEAILDPAKELASLASAELMLVYVILPLAAAL